MVLLLLVLLVSIGIVFSVIWIIDAYNAIIMISWLMGCVRREALPIPYDDENMQILPIVTEGIDD